MTATASLTASETFLSMNAFDEIAVSRAFEDDIYTLKEKPFAFLRALAFVTFRRNGAKDAEARNAAFELRIGDLKEFFPKDPNQPDPDADVDPADPFAEQGADDAGEASPGA